MKPFDPDAKCPKCGGDVIRTNYHQELAYFKTTRCGLGFREHMHRQCAGCGYEWDEAPLDAARKGGSDEPAGSD